MSRWGTLTILALLGLYLMQGPHAAPIPPQTEWAGFFVSPHLALPFVSARDTLAQQPDADAERDRQPDTVSRAGSLPPAAGVSSASDEAEYKARCEECESLPGDARNHCIEYVKLRFGRS